MEYLIDFSTANQADLDEWPYAPGYYCTMKVRDLSHYIYCAKYGTTYLTARGPVRAVADGGVVEFEFEITAGDEDGSDYWQYYPTTGCRCDFFIQIGNSKFGLAVWYYSAYDDPNEVRICKLVGTTADYHFQRNTGDSQAVCKVRYNSTTGLAEAFVDDSLVHSATYGTGLDVTFGLYGISKADYAMELWTSYFKFTAGILSDVLYAGTGTDMAMEIMKFKSPYDGLTGNGGRYDIEYAPELVNLFPLPDNYVLSTTFTDVWWTQQMCSMQIISNPTVRKIDVLGHWSGSLRFFARDRWSMEYETWSVWIHAINITTGAREVWECRHTRVGISPDYFHVTIIEPDGTECDAFHEWGLVSSTWTRIYIDVDEDETSITFTISNNDRTISATSLNFNYEYYKFVEVSKTTEPNSGELAVGGFSWWFRGYPAVEDLVASIMTAPMFGLPMTSCTGEQWMEKVFNVFRNAIYNPLLPDDPATMKGMKLTNVDGQGTDMAIDSVCVLIDMYKRVYVYVLKIDPVVVESIPDIITAFRSKVGHYWELIDIKTANDEGRIYSEQCAVEVSEETPGICDYDPAADTSKTMVQLVHEGVVNPLYLRAYKVPGQHQIRVETSEPISAYEVIVNILLAI